MSRQPNIVYVLTDDQGYGDLGCTGNPIIKTPNIDKFYEESTHFTDFHVGPTCAPTRSGLMTGHYANSTGVWHTVGGRSLLRSDEVTLASALKDGGYRTGIFGKWHLGDEYPFRPIDRGFDETVVHGGGGITQTPDYWGNDYFDDTYFANGVPKKYKGYCTDVFFDEAMGFIERHKEVPFFCYIACNAPHGPYNVKDTYSEQYKGLVDEDRACFYGMITNIDENFARLQDKLKALKLEEDTILIFMTDNGSSGAATLDDQQHVIEGYNAGLRGLKGSEYDGGHRVPFFMQWKNGCLGSESRDIDQLTANVDFMPTLLDLCDVAYEHLDFHGESLVPYIKEDVLDYDRVMVTDSQRLTYPVKWRQSAVMTSKWRLINGCELYDISRDRGQCHEISQKHPEVVEELRQGYDKWWEIVSSQYDEMIPYVLGDRISKITCHDIRNEESHTAWHQEHVRGALKIEGYYEIEVEVAGTYSFDLRRWPQSLDLPLSSPIDFEDITFEKAYVQEKNWCFYTGGQALDIVYAEVKIQGKEMTKKVGSDAVKARIELELEKGLTRLECNFLDGEKNHLSAAYFIEVRKI